MKNWKKNEMGKKKVKWMKMNWENKYSIKTLRPKGKRNISKKLGIKPQTRKGKKE